MFCPSMSGCGQKIFNRQLTCPLLLSILRIIVYIEWVRMIVF